VNKTILFNDKIAIPPVDEPLLV